MYSNVLLFQFRYLKVYPGVLCCSEFSSQYFGKKGRSFNVLLTKSVRSSKISRRGCFHRHLNFPSPVSIVIYHLYPHDYRFLLSISILHSYHTSHSITLKMINNKTIKMKSVNRFKLQLSVRSELYLNYFESN